VYTQYIINFDTAAAEIDRQEKKNKKFSDFLEKTYNSPACANGQRFLAFLILPVQRIPRYQLLLRVIKTNIQFININYSKLGSA